MGLILTGNSHFCCRLAGSSYRCTGIAGTELWPAQDLPLQGLGGDPKWSRTPWIGWAAGPTAVGAARARGEPLSAWSSTSSAPPPPAGCFQGKGRCFLQSLPAIPCLRGGWGSEEKPDGWLCFPGHPLAAQNPVMQFPGRLSDE